MFFITDLLSVKCTGTCIGQTKILTYYGVVENIFLFDSGLFSLVKLLSSTSVLLQCTWESKLELLKQLIDYNIR